MTPLTTRIVGSDGRRLRWLTRTDNSQRRLPPRADPDSDGRLGRATRTGGSDGAAVGRSLPSAARNRRARLPIRRRSRPSRSRRRRRRRRQRRARAKRGDFKGGPRDAPAGCCDACMFSTSNFVAAFACPGSGPKPGPPGPGSQARAGRSGRDGHGLLCGADREALRTVTRLRGRSRGPQ